jgi:hypothetical protein
MPFEKMKPGPRQKSIGQTKRKLAHHKLEEKEGAARDVRRRCVGCYEKIGNNNQEKRVIQQQRE